MGTRYGGRAKGTPNKRTTETRLLAAQFADRAINSAPTELLAKDVMAELLRIARNMVAFYQPSTPNFHNKNFNERKLERWINNTRKVGVALAPYQSPTFQRIAITGSMLSPNDIDPAPIRYETIDDIRRELAAQGLPPLQRIIEDDVIEAEIIDEPLVDEDA